MAVPHDDPCWATAVGSRGRTGRVSCAVLAVVGLVAAVVGVQIGQRSVEAQGVVAMIDAPASALAPAVRGPRRHRHFPPPPPGKIIFPVDAAVGCAVFWDSFGQQRGGGTRKHEGTDIMGSGGRAVYAVADGVLTKRYVDSGLTSGAGNGWTLDAESGDIRYKYFHMTDDTAGRVEGEHVVVGDVIGYVGDTGTIDGNFHLHFEYRPGDVAVNPVSSLDIPSPPCKLY